MSTLGYKPSPETRAKMSAALRGAKNPNWKGGGRSQESKEQSEAYRKSPEARAKQRAWRQRPESKEQARKRDEIRRQRPETKKRHRAGALRRLYGLTVEAFEAMLFGQGEVCAICGTSDWPGPGKSPVIDHDHATGIVRGILCYKCNVAIGLLGDNPQTIRIAANYLERKRA